MSNAFVDEQDDDGIRSRESGNTVPFESIRQSRITDPCVDTKFELCHGSWGRFVELIFHVTNHSNCLGIVEKWVEATKKIPHLVSPNYS